MFLDAVLESSHVDLKCLIDDIDGTVDILVGVGKAGRLLVRQGLSLDCGNAQARIPKTG